MHTPVLLTEVMHTLAPKKGESVLDVTVGFGGHSEAMLKAIGPSGHLIALDADNDNIALAEERLRKYQHQTTFIHTNFSALPNCLSSSHQTFDIILADLGMSSMHIDDPTRGFSFRFDAPLDLRFNRTDGMTAAQLLQSTDTRTLELIFQEYGELPRTYAFVRAITEYRSAHTISRTGDILSIAETVYHAKSSQYLPQIFQALRIAVNDELGALKHLLNIAPILLRPGGRLGIISFHSLEDRLVKHAFRDMITGDIDPLTGQSKHDVQFKLITKKPILPSDDEVKRNPRARSAVFRVLLRKDGVE